MQKFFRLSLVSALAAAVPHAAISQTTATGETRLQRSILEERIRPSSMPEVVVTGREANAVTSQIAETRETYAGSVSTVTPEELEVQKPSNLGEVIARIPGATYVDEDGRGTKPDVGLRGLNPIRSEYVQLLLDGVPIQPSLYSEQAAYYGPPAERIAGIEVFKGGSSILFGPNTVGGVVNLISRPLTTERFAGVLDTRYDSYGDYLGNLYVGGSFGKASFGLEVLHKGGDGFRDSLGYRINDIDFKLGFQLNEKHSAQIHFQYYDEVSETPGGLLPRQFRENRTESNKPHDEFHGERMAVDIRTRHQISERQRLELLMYAYRFERNWFLQNYVSDTTPDLTLAENNSQFLREFSVFGFEPKYSLQYDLGSMKDNELTVGGRVYVDSVDRRVATGKTGRAREGNSTLTSEETLGTLVLAAYAQNEFRLTERFSIIPGVRFEHIDQKREDLFNGLQEQSSDYDVWVPGVGLRYTLAPGTVLYANVTRSFRPPTFGESFNPELGASTGDLDPSTAWTYEAGVRATPYPWLAIDAGGFYTQFTDQVVISNGTAGNFDTQTFGVEGTARAGLVSLVSAVRSGNYQQKSDHDVYVQGGFTLVKSTFADGEFEDNELPYVPNTTLTFGVGYEYRDKVDLLFQGRYIGERFTDNGNTEEENETGTVGKLGDYTVFDLKGRWQATERLSFNAGINNLFDESYATQRRTSQQKGVFPGPTRVFYVASTLTF